MLVRIISGWLLMLVAAMANGVIRELTYGRTVQTLRAHQISTVTGLLLLGAVMWAVITWWPPRTAREAIVTGLVWAAMTVVFEFLLGYFGGGQTWAEMIGQYNLADGHLWALIPLWILVAPPLFHRLR